MKIRLVLKHILGLVILTSSVCSAQLSSVTADVVPPQPGNHNYINGLNETVNPGNGALNIHIDLPMPDGRDLTLPFSIDYNSNQEHTFVGPFTPSNGGVQADNQSLLSQGGWAYQFPMLQAHEHEIQVSVNQGSQPQYYICYYYTDYRLNDMAGSPHMLNVSTAPQNPQGYCGSFRNVLTGGDYTVQAVAAQPGSGFNFNQFTGVTVADRDGTVYSFTKNPLHSFGNVTSPVISVLPETITDRNGNQAVVTDNGNGAFSVTDSAGRAVLSTSGFGASTGDTIKIGGGPSPLQFTVNWENLAANSSFQSVTSVDPPYAGSVGCGGSTSWNLTLPEVMSIQLPNGQSYQFTYDGASGLLQQIKYPDGGTVTYTWGYTSGYANALDFYHPTSWGTHPPVPPNQPGPCHEMYQTQVVTKRVVSFDGQTPALVQDFQYATNWNAVSSTYQQWTTKKTIVHTTDYVRGTNFYTTYNYIPWTVIQQPNDATQYGNNSNMVESSIVYQDSNGAVLRTVNKSYTADVLPPTVTTVLDTGQTSQKKLVYSFPNQSLGQPYIAVLSDEYDYDFGSNGPGALLRQTHKDYNSYTSPLFPSTLPSILDRPKDVLTKDGQGNEVAETDYCYDGDTTAFSGCVGSSIAPVSALGHDDADFGTSGSVHRGNVTTKIEKCFVGSAATSCAQGINIVSRYKFDQTGQLLQKIDPNSNPTSYSYADSFASDDPTEGAAPGQTNAYLTLVTDALNHTRSFQYAFSDGELRQEIGENPQDITHYYYQDTTTHIDDPLRRLKETDFADGGQTQLRYNDQIYTPSTFTQKKLDSGRYVSSTAIMDGIGHVTHTQLNSDVSTDYVDTVYEGLHTVHSVSNAYRSTSDPTYGASVSLYDALDRVYQVTKQDGATTHTTFSGNATTTTDEIGNARRTITDGLGRLIEVDEPGGNTGFPAHGNVAVNAVNGSGLQTTMVGSSPGTAASATIAISGESAYCDSGTVTMAVGSAPADTVTYGCLFTAQQMAQALAQYFSSSQVTATASQVTDSFHWQIKLAATQAGTAGNGITFSFSQKSFTPGQYPAAYTFSVSSSNLSGGVNPITGTQVTDYGTVTAALNGASLTVCYGPNPSSSCNGVNNSGADQVMSALLAPFQNSPVWGTRVGQSSAGSATFLVYSKNNTAANNGPVTITSTTSLPQYFSQGSFNGGGTLSGGLDPSPASIDTPFVTLYKYDALGNLLCVEQHGDTMGTGCSSYPNVTPNDPWRPRMFKYDSLSELLSAYNPETGTITYSYDPNGNVVNKTSPQPNQLQGSTATTTSTYCYDALNRLVAKGFVNSPNAAQQCSTASPYLPNPWAVYSYDQGTNGIGQRTGMTDLSGSTSWSYDSMGRLSSEQRTINPGGSFSSVSRSIGYKYNLLGKVTQITYPDNTQIQYGIDNAGRDLSATDITDGLNYVSNATYAPDGSIAGFTEQVGSSTVTNSFLYNPRAQICREVASTTGVVPASCTDSTHVGNVMDFQYDFHYGTGDNGNLYVASNNKDPYRTQAFSYDTLNRLLTAKTTGTDCTVMVPGSNTQTKYWGESFIYDPWANLINKSSTFCNAENTPLGATYNNQLAGYGYDISGNLLGSGTNVSYVYDAESELAATTASGATYNYLYDGDGNRVAKISGSSGTLYWYGGPEIVLETDLSGSPQSEYVFFAGQRVARRDVGGTNAVYYYFSNQIHSTALIADANGNVKDDADYYPWGGMLQFSTGVANHYWFSGKERDPESQLDYFGARYYGNSFGRFTTPDWSAKAEGVPYADFHDPQSLNLYSYVRNHPTYTIDPDGHCPQCAVAVLANPVVIVGGAVVLTALIASPAGRQALGNLTVATGNALSHAYNSASKSVSDAFAYQGDGTTMPHDAGISTAPYGVVNSNWFAQSNVNSSAGSNTPSSAGQTSNAQPASPQNNGTSGGPRAGKDFTKKGKKDVIDANRKKNNGQTKCEKCGRTTTPAQQSQAGVTPPDDETHVDHIIAKSKGGDGSPSNGQVLCRVCNLDKSNK